MTGRTRDMACSACGWEQGRDTKICIVAEGATLGCDTTALRCDTAQQRSMIRRREAHDTRGGAATRRAWSSLRHGRPGLRHCHDKDDHKPRHGRTQATIRLGCTRRLGQGVRTVHPNQF